MALRLSHCPRLHDPLASSSSSPIRRLLFTAQLPRHGAASSEVQCPSAVIRRLSQLGTAVLKPRLSSFRTGVLVFLAAVGGGSSFLASPFVVLFILCIMRRILLSSSLGCDPPLRHCACRPGTRVLSDWGFLGSLDSGGSFFFSFLFLNFFFHCGGFDSRCVPRWLLTI